MYSIFMKRLKMNAFIAALFVAAVSCDGDSNSPTAPTTASVAGTWEFFGSILDDGCAMAESGDLADAVSVTQSGAALTAVDSTGNAQFTGATTAAGFQLTQSNPITMQGSGATISVAATLRATLTTTTGGTGSWGVNMTCSGAGCASLNYPCSSIWLGNWTKTL